MIRVVYGGLVIYPREHIMLHVTMLLLALQVLNFHLLQAVLGLSAKNVIKNY